MSEVEVWRFDLDGDGAAEEPLSALERRRAAAIVRPLARRRWVAARAALRGVLGERLGREPAAVEIHTAPGGKPYLVDADDMRFSLSHSGDVALIALRRGGEVGIDLERVGRRPRAF
ncbi:MAG TPA: hypothetical protein VEQ41_10110, partial [Solirubrobacterales bacterium]|nr:hypothetical protein [Solirubrobacterales bacterium]